MKINNYMVVNGDKIKQTEINSTQQLQRKKKNTSLNFVIYRHK